MRLGLIPFPSCLRSGPRGRGPLPNAFLPAPADYLRRDTWSKIDDAVLGVAGWEALGHGPGRVVFWIDTLHHFISNYISSAPFSLK